MSKPSLQLRFWLFTTGVVFPIAAVAATYFMGGAGGSLVPQLYQSGEAWVFAGVLLGWSCLTVMIPLMLFCLFGLTTWVIWPTSGRHLAVRSGIYSGSLLSATYLVIACVAQASATLIAATVTAVVLAPTIYFVSKIATHWRRFSIAHLLVLTTVVCFLMAVASYLLGETGGIRSVGSWVGSAFLVALVATPALNCLAYLIGSFLVFRVEKPSTIHWTVQLATWLGISVGWYISWKEAVDMMFLIYATLPRNRNCYVTNAAANGHSILVGPNRLHSQRWGDTKTGEAVIVTLQMQRCKFVEICLATASPRIHVGIRRIYDKVGPSLAKLCARNVWFADATFLILKPVEWTAIVLGCILQVPAARIGAIYLPKPN